MTKIIAIVNSKGGTGKTTTCINLAAYLTAFGHSVLILDLDPEASATIALGFKLKYQGLSWAILKKHSLVHAIQKTSILGCDLASLGSQTNQALSFIQRAKKSYLKLKSIFPSPSRLPYDYVLIDCPPDLGLLTLNALELAGYILIPIQTEFFALNNLKRLLNNLENFKKHYKMHFRILGLVLTMFDPRNKLSHQVIQQARHQYDRLVFKTIIPRNVSLAEAPLYKKTILKYAPGSSGARAYRDLTKEILKSC